jgi:hypothetical protein
MSDYRPDKAVVLGRYAAEFAKKGRALELLYRAETEKGTSFSSWIPDLMNRGAAQNTVPRFPRGTRPEMSTVRGSAQGHWGSPNATVSYETSKQEKPMLLCGIDRNNVYF